MNSSLCHNFIAKANWAINIPHQIMLRFYDVQRTNAGTEKCYGLKLEWKEIDPTEAIEENKIMQIGKDEASQLMEALWEIGIRPRAKISHSEVLAAQGKHLEDMRRIVFDPKPSTFKE